jgi:hypothetical protein
VSDLYNQIADITQQWADEKVKKAKGILNANGIHNQQQLPASIRTYQSIGKSGILIEFFANDYYIFIDEGVEGIGGGKKPKKPTTGKYKFKTPYVGRKMVDNIQDWIARKPILIRKNKTESAKQSVIPRAQSIAYVIAKSVKRTGIGKTMFWSDTFNEKAYEDLANRIGKALGREIKITI